MLNFVTNESYTLIRQIRPYLYASTRMRDRNVTSGDLLFHACYSILYKLSKPGDMNYHAYCFLTVKGQKKANPDRCPKPIRQTVSGLQLPISARCTGRQTKCHQSLPLFEEASPGLISRQHGSNGSMWWHHRKA